MTDVQVLAPMHRGAIGTQALNQLLQEHYTSGNREHHRWRGECDDT